MQAQNRQPIALFAAASIVAALTLVSTHRSAQTAGRAGCNAVPRASACSAVRGDRAEGWLPQTRSAVMATHGMVVTRQPLAAQAGLRILLAGGNAVDAAVATAAALNATEPMNVGMGGDVFAIICIAKEHRVHVLNASGKTPSGATIAHFNALGYAYDQADWGPGSGHAVRRHPRRHGSRVGLGMG